MVSLTLIGISTVIFGVGALVLASRARSRLTPGSLRKFIDNFSVCLAFVVIFSLWQTVRSATGSQVTLSGFKGYPEIIFIIFAYIAFIIASYRVMKISQEFGFKEEGKKIGKLVKKRGK